MMMLGNVACSVRRARSPLRLAPSAGEHKSQIRLQNPSREGKLTSQVHFDDVRTRRQPILLKESLGAFRVPVEELGLAKPGATSVAKGTHGQVVLLKITLGTLRTRRSTDTSNALFLTSPSIAP